VAAIPARARGPVRARAQVATLLKRLHATPLRVDGTTIRQRQSIDFRRLDAGDLGDAGPSEGTEVLVPLWIAGKVLLNDLNITDERGAALSLRSRYENGRSGTVGRRSPVGTMRV
jgi:hypothetical protein